MTIDRFSFGRVNTGEELLRHSSRLKLDLWHCPGERETTCDFELHGSFDLKPGSEDSSDAVELLRCLVRDFRTVEREGGECDE